MKRISTLNVKDKQFLSEFSDWFGETRTLNTTLHIEIKDNLTFVVTPVAFKPRLGKELKSMVEVRVWLDPKPLNNVQKQSPKVFCEKRCS